MAVFAPLDPIPQAEPPIDGVNGQFRPPWFRWFSQLVARSVLGVLRVGSGVHRTGLSASIVASTLFTPSQTGDFRVSYYAQVTQAATTSSSLTVTIGWTTNGIAQSKTFAPATLTTNTTASNDGDSLLIRADKDVPVTYATAYTSVGGTVMQYQVDVYAEFLP